MLRIGDKTEEKSAGRKEKKNTDNGKRIHTHDDEYGKQAGQGPLLRPLGNC